MVDRNQSRRRLILGVALVLLFVFSVPWSRLVGQDDRGVALIAVPAAVHRRQGFDAADSSALFVGVRTFNDPALTTVPYAVDDAVDLAYLFAFELNLVKPDRVGLAISGSPQKETSQAQLKELREAGAEVVEATQSNIIRLLARQSSIAGADGLFLIGLATHGFTTGGQQYLFATDTLLLAPQLTGVPVNTLFEQLSQAGTLRRFALIDACKERLGEPRRGIAQASPMGQALQDAINAAEGEVVLGATTTGGYAYDDRQRRNGVFTAAILDGLRGNAPKTEEHFVTAWTLAEYVNRRVIAWVRKHRPGAKTRGITVSIEGQGANLPLAADPKAVATTQEYKNHRTVAMDLLRANLGGPLTQDTFECVQDYLQVELPTDDRNLLLTEIDSFDGTPRSKWRLADYLREHVSECADSVTDMLAVCKDHFNRHRLTTGPGGNALDCYEDVLKHDLENGEAIAGLERIAETSLRRAKTAWERGDTERAKNHLKQAREASPEHPEVAELEDRFAQRPPGPFEPPPFPEGGRVWSSNLIGMEFVFVPPGWFEMGSHSHSRYERPVHRVSVKGFWLSRHEVTQRQYRNLMDVNPATFKRGLDHPVEQVSWSDAQAFVAKFNDQFGPGFRLPSEAEWEYACRSGGQPETYCGGEDLDQLAWFVGNTEGKSTQPVGSKPPGNGLGLMDMSGNVSEWVQDCFHDGYQGAPADGSAWEAHECARRLIRGGSWNDFLSRLRAARRRGVDPEHKYNTVGFRLARSP